MTRLFLFAACAGLLVISAARAEESCNLRGNAMMSRDAITKSLASRGYTTLRSLSTHNGCYEAKGIDNKGHRFELELNGATGAIQNAE